MIAGLGLTACGAAAGAATWGIAHWYSPKYRILTPELTKVVVLSKDEAEVFGKRNGLLQLYELETTDEVVQIRFEAKQVSRSGGGSIGFFFGMSNNRYQLVNIKRSAIDDNWTVVRTLRQYQPDFSGGSASSIGDIGSAKPRSDGTVYFQLTIKERGVRGIVVNTKSLHEELVSNVEGWNEYSFGKMGLHFVGGWRIKNLSLKIGDQPPENFNFR